MNRSTRDPEQLEKFIGAMLREQPLRIAPASIEARVQQELAQYAALPWWRRGFSRWPWQARLLFLPLAFGCVQVSSLTNNGVSWLWQALSRSAPGAAAQSGIASFSGMEQALQTLGNMLSRGVPTIWIYGAAGFALLLYAVMFGLGAAAFRTLFATPEPVR